MFSVGLLYSAKDFLSLCLGASMTPNEFRRHFSRYKYSTADKIIGVVFSGHWVRLNTEGQIELTPRGEELSRLAYKEALLRQLEDLIRNENPMWASLLAKGRQEALNFLPADVCQCFKEAGLFETLSEELIEYWDRLALAYRNYSQKQRLETGREGEKSSFLHEWERTGAEPFRQAIESNLAGFDLLSIVDTDNDQKLKIEVKATTGNPAYAQIHITEHEWDTATNSLHYLFHLWHLGSSPTLYKVSPGVIGRHIPVNSGEGRWESVVIPFAVLIGEQ